MYYAKVLNRNIVMTNSVIDGVTVYKISLGSQEIEGSDVVAKKAHQKVHREVLLRLCPEILERFEAGIDVNLLLSNTSEVTMDLIEYRKIRIDDYRIIPMCKLTLVNAGTFIHSFPVSFIHQLHNRL
jgi:hypothetical protein